MSVAMSTEGRMTLKKVMKSQSYLFFSSNRLGHFMFRSQRNFWLLSFSCILRGNEKQVDVISWTVFLKYNDEIDTNCEALFLSYQHFIWLSCLLVRGILLVHTNTYLSLRREKRSFLYWERESLLTIAQFSSWHWCADENSLTLVIECLTHFLEILWTNDSETRWPSIPRNLLFAKSRSQNRPRRSMQLHEVEFKSIFVPPCKENLI